MDLSVSKFILRSGSKRLAAVDLPGGSSHQHEIGDGRAFRHVFEPDDTGPVMTEFLFLNGSQQNLISAEVFYYNSRQRTKSGVKARSPEYRVYYPPSVDSHFSLFRPGDLCVFLKDINHRPFIVVANTSSPFYTELYSIFSPERNGRIMEPTHLLSERLIQLLRLKSEFLVFNLSDFSYAGQEGIGSKEKAWYASSDNSQRLFLFKKPNRHAGEAWAEKICFELATAIGIKAAQIHLCLDSTTGTYGSLSRSFIPRPKAEVSRKQSSFREFQEPELIHGNQFMNRAFGERYSSVKFTRKNPLYTIENIYFALRNAELQDLWPQLLEFFYFDCLIGNLDRHHENWGIVRYLNTGGTHKYDELAPTFDHGPALDSGSNDQKKEQILAANEVLNYYRRGQTALHRKEGGRARLPDLLEDCLQFEKLKYGHLHFAMSFAEKLSRLTPDRILDILKRMPSPIMTEVSVRFTYNYLVTSRMIILERINGKA